MESDGHLVKSKTMKPLMPVGCFFKVLCMGEKWEMELSSCFPDAWIRSRQMCWGGKWGHTVEIDVGCILRTVYIGNGNVFNCALMWHTTVLAHFYYLTLSFPQTNCTPTKGFQTSKLDEKSHIWKQLLFKTSIRSFNVNMVFSQCITWL